MLTELATAGERHNGATLETREADFSGMELLTLGEVPLAWNVSRQSQTKTSRTSVKQERAMAT